MSLEGPSRGNHDNREPVFDAREKEHSIFTADGAAHLEDELKETNAGEHHVSNLFDENESRFGGDKMDLATGKPIDNSTSDPLDGLAIHDPLSSALDDADDDDAARWLRENDPEYKKAA